jgi:hypothetical protein
MAKARTPLQPPKQRPRSSSRFKRSETFRLLKGVEDAGHTVRGVEIDPTTGVLRVLIGKPGIEPDRDTPKRIIENL